MTRIFHSLDSNSRTLHNPAMRYGGQTISYGQLILVIQHTVESLKKAGIKPGDRIGIIGSNHPGYIVLLLSLWAIKAIACPVNTRQPKKSINEQLQSIHAVSLVVSDKDDLQSEEIAVKKFLLSALIDPAAFISPQIPCTSVGCINYEEDQPATILFTSGSSARPKAVLHTLGNHVLNAQDANTCVPFSEKDCWLLSLPLYHVGGLGIIFRSFLQGGGIMIPQPDESISDILKKGIVTHLSAVPTQLIRLLNKEENTPRLQAVKAILLGGCPIPENLLQRSARLKLSVYITYGMTESASQIATSRYPSPAKVLPHQRVKIANDREILVKGDSLFKGYVRGNKIDLPVDADGWFATGDLGTMNGKHEIIVSGRKDNMFISGGENIQPEEIEYYLSLLDSVEQALVVPVPHAEFGFRPVAFLKIADKNYRRRKDIVQWLQNNLPKYKIPDQFYGWPDSSKFTHSKLNRKSFFQELQKDRITLQEIE